MLCKDLVQSFMTDQGDQCTHRPNLSTWLSWRFCKHAASSFDVLKQTIEQYHKHVADQIYNCDCNRTIALQEPTLHGRRNQTERIQSLERNMKYWNLQVHHPRCVFVQMRVGGSVKTQLSYDGDFFSSMPVSKFNLKFFFYIYKYFIFIKL